MTEDKLYTIKYTDDFEIDPSFSLDHDKLQPFVDLGLISDADAKLTEKYSYDVQTAISRCKYTIIKTHLKQKFGLVEKKVDGKSDENLDENLDENDQRLNSLIRRYIENHSMINDILDYYKNNPVSNVVNNETCFKDLMLRLKSRNLISAYKKVTKVLGCEFNSTGIAIKVSEFDKLIEGVKFSQVEIDEINLERLHKNTNLFELVKAILSRFAIKLTVFNKKIRTKHGYHNTKFCSINSDPEIYEILYLIAFKNKKQYKEEFYTHLLNVHTVNAGKINHKNDFSDLNAHSDLSKLIECKSITNKEYETLIPLIDIFTDRELTTYEGRMNESIRACIGDEKVITSYEEAQKILNYYFKPAFLEAFEYNLFVEYRGIKKLLNDAKNKEDKFNSARYMVYDYLIECIRHDPENADYYDEDNIKRLRDAGQMLYNKEGVNGMHDELLWSFIPKSYSREIDHAWDGIGEWTS